MVAIAKNAFAFAFTKLVNYCRCLQFRVVAKLPLGIEGKAITTNSFARKSNFLQRAIRNSYTSLMRASHVACSRLCLSQGFEVVRCDCTMKWLLLNLLELTRCSKMLSGWTAIAGSRSVIR